MTTNALSMPCPHAKPNATLPPPHTVLLHVLPWLMVALITGLAPLSTLAGTFYVSRCAPSGGDGSAAHPFATILEAHAAAMPGTAIHISAGGYPERPRLTKPLKLFPSGGRVRMGVAAPPCAGIEPPGTFQVFEVGEIPSLNAPNGQTMRLAVRSSDLGEDATITVSSDSPPRGPVTYDERSGVISYTPDPIDKRPFTLKVVASAGGRTRTQTIEITPMPQLPPEQTTFGLFPQHPLPDADSKDYLLRNEVLSEVAEQFNTELRRTRTVTLIGKDIVFQPGHQNGLFEIYHDASDVRSMTIYAEKVIVKSVLKLPRTDLTIYARSLEFDDQAGPTLIQTTPRSNGIRPASATGNTPGMDGLHGEPAGQITLQVDRVIESGSRKRFILTGGNGQPAGLGRDGIDGNSVTPFTRFTGCRDFGVPEPDKCVGFWFKQTTSCTGHKCNSAQPAERWIASGDNRTFKETAWPTSGTDAVPAGRPGDAGRGGDFKANMDLGGFVENRGGNAGDPGFVPKGGRAGTPTLAKVWYNGCEGTSLYADRRTIAGRDASAPLARVLVGSAGRVEQIGHPLSWLSPFALRQIIAQAKDAYLYGHYPYAAKALQDYDSILTSSEFNLSRTNLPPGWEVDFDALREEIQMLLHRLASHLDYFGNPAGWVPMLSFEANLTAFRNEVDPAVRTLYLSYWMGNAASSLDQKLQGLATARERLSTQVAQNRDEYAKAMELLPVLETEYIALSNNTERVRVYVSQVELALENQAQHNVQQRHKVPGWKKVAKVAGTILSVVPIGQPALGAVGQGLSLIADYDSRNPLATVAGIAGIAGQFSGGKLKASMSSWKTELNKLSLDDFTKRGLTITNCVESTNYTIQVVNGVRVTNATVSVDCSQRRYSPLEYVKNLQGYGKAITAGFNVYRELNSRAEAPAGEVGAELQRLKAENPEFTRAIDEISRLMAQKELFQARLAEATQASAQLQDSITQNLLMIDGLNRDSSAGLAILDARAISYLREMERRAKERLLKYHYFLAQAYQYRLMEPYLGELRLDRLFDKFRDIAQSGKGSELSQADFEVLRNIYEEQLSSITSTIIDRFNSNPTEYQGQVSLEVPADKLAELRPNNPIRVRVPIRDYFFPSEENLRIANLEVDPGKLGVHFAQAIVPFKLRVTHSGKSQLTFDGKHYLFRHYNDGNRSPLRWGIRYNKDGRIVPEEPSDATESLLYSLLESSGYEDKILLFARPGVDTELEISLESVSALTPVAITNLVLNLTFDYTDRRRSVVNLDVVEDVHGFMPYQILSQPDQNGLQDGRGGFLRTYPLGERVTIEAQQRIGNWHFIGWTAGHDLGSQVTSRILTLDMIDDLTIRAEYDYRDTSDSDRDSLPDRWETLYFGSLSYGPKDDPDRDGVTNDLEFSTGGSPDLVGSPSRILGSSIEDQRLIYTWSTIPGRVYQLQMSADLSPDGWRDLGTPLEAAGASITWTIPFEQEAEFFRIVEL